MNELGVSTSPTARQDANGNPIPDDYSPLGNTYTPAKRVELAVLGVELAGATDRMAIVDDLGDGGGMLFSSGGHALPGFQRGSRGNPNTRRDATAGDIDGDGFDELVAAYMRDQELVLRVYDDAAAGFAMTESVVTLAEGVVDLRAATGDVNGDGTAEVLLAVAYADRGELLIATKDGDRFVLLDGIIKTIDSTMPGGTISMEIATGNVDYDPAAETVLVFNEEDRAGAGHRAVFRLRQCRRRASETEQRSGAGHGAGRADRADRQRRPGRHRRGRAGRGGAGGPDQPRDQL